MPKKPTTEAAAQKTATTVAEGIGEALARVVNRLESLDTERDKAYKQLLALQQRLNVQVTRFGRAMRQTVTSPSPSRGVRSRSSTTTRRTASKKRSGASPTKARKKSPIKCGVCGTPGHNARGHAKWKASQRK